MTRLLQNRIAESGTAFVVTAFYAVVVWLMAGAIQNAWWIQMGSMALTSYLMLELNTSNALLRIRSRMISCTLLALTSAAPPLFASMRSSLIYVTFMLALHMLFKTYQNTHAAAHTYYASLFIGIACLTDVHILLIAPLIWILCATQLKSLSWHTWLSSLLGLLTPYWIIIPWIIYHRSWEIIDTYLAPITKSEPLSNATLPSFSIIATITLTLILSLFSFVHFLQKGYEDRIRTRQLYGFFAIILISATLAFIVFPHFVELLAPLIFICASPFIAHLFALTSSKATNALFIVSIVFIVIITAAGLSPYAESQLSLFFENLWNASPTS